jgi:hypothetical protein
MPRPRKRTSASRESATHSALKRRKIAKEFTLDASVISDASESSESDSDALSEGTLSEEEDQYPITEPEAGWEEAEKALYGYSKTRVYKQKISYHRNKDTLKRKREEKKASSAGISVTQRPKPVWGDISKMLNSKDSNLSPTQSARSYFTLPSQPLPTESSQSFSTVPSQPLPTESSQSSREQQSPAIWIAPMAPHLLNCLSYALMFLLISKKLLSATKISKMKRAN